MFLKYFIPRSLFSLQIFRRVNILSLQIKSSIKVRSSCCIAFFITSNNMCQRVQPYQLCKFEVRYSWKRCSQLRISPKYTKTDVYKKWILCDIIEGLENSIDVVCTKRCRSYCNYSVQLDREICRATTNLLKLLKVLRVRNFWITSQAFMMQARYVQENDNFKFINQM